MLEPEAGGAVCGLDVPVTPSNGLRMPQDCREVRPGCVSLISERGAQMTEARTYTGGCHCGQIRYECTTDLAMVTACNCSICTKKGLHFTFLPPQSFQLRAGADQLKEYLFNKHAIRHQFCGECGVEVFARGEKPDGTQVIALNVSTIDQIELASLMMTPVDGRNR